MKKAFKLIALFIIYISKFAFGVDFLPTKDLMELEMPAWNASVEERKKLEDQVDKIKDGLVFDVYHEDSSTYNGVERSCRFTKFPEEDENNFKWPSPYVLLRKFYEDQQMVEKYKNFDSIYDYPDVAAARDFYSEVKPKVNNLYGQIRREIADMFSSTEINEFEKNIVGDLLSDPENFEDLLFKTKGDPDLPIRFRDKSKTIEEDREEFRIHENSRKAMQSIHKILNRNRKLVHELQEKREHFESKKEHAEGNLFDLKKEYKRARANVSGFKKDKELMKLKEKIDYGALLKLFERRRDYVNDEKFINRNITIVFEGTGQYSPQLEDNLKTLQTSLGLYPTQEEVERVNAIANKISYDKSYFATQEDKDTWSGTIKGPIQKGLYSREDKMNNLRSNQWLYMPSENAETLASINNLIKEDEGVGLSSREEVFSRANECLKKYLKRYPDAGVSLIGHSSGVKAALDFADQMKKNGINEKVSILGIDPVRDFADSGFEGYLKSGLDKMSQILNPAYSCIVSLAGKKPKIGGEWTDDLQRPSNARYLRSFYQSSDTEGLDGSFGIWGSPVRKADENTELASYHFEKPSKAHGEITQHEDVIKEARKIMK